MDKRDVVVGIDLGTTNSSIGIMYPNGNIEMVLDRASAGSHPRHFIPSCVYFPNNTDRILVGTPAARKKKSNTSQGMVVFDAKRLFGKRTSSQEVQQWQRIVNIPVIDVGGRPVIGCQFNGQLMHQQPEDISAKVLKTLIENAEEQLNTRSTDNYRITKAVICIPAHFNSGQKEQTKAAATRAGLNDVKFLTEPSAAAYSFGYHESDYDNINILVYDFGGGTFDVSIMSIKGRVFEVIEKAGLMDLGGRDLDNELFNHCDRLIQERFGIDCKTKRQWAQNLRNQCEEVKENLSQMDEAYIYLNFLNIDEDEDLIVTAKEYEDLIMEKVTQTIQLTMQTLAKAKMEVDDIQEVLLVGGSSRTPLVAKLLRERGLNPKIPPRPEIAIAHGAAVFGGMAFNEMKSQMPKMKLIETTPLSIGIRSDMNIFSKIIERNTKIPCKKTRIYSTSINDQQSMRFELYEGERPIASLNNHLGTLLIDGLTPGIADSKNVHLTLEVDEDGMLTVYAKHREVEEQMTIKYEPQAEFNEQQLEEKIREAAQNAEEDRAEQQRMHAKSNLKVQIEKKKYKCESQRILDLCEEYALWLEANDDAGIAELQQKLEDFKRQAD